MMMVELRRFPYPYRAALTICSDIDGTSFDHFLQIHEFLNTNHSTSLGKGLQLPIGDSFWMYDRPDIANHAFSYFSDSSGHTSSIAPQIRELIHSGILDVMHGFGNFTSRQDFSRRLAGQAIDELVKHDLKLSVWTNHGGLESTQNIGQSSGGQGDVKDSPFYHTDLLLNYGLMFYWDAERSLLTNIGQDCPALFGDAYWRSPLYKGAKNRMKSAIKGLLTLADTAASPLLRKNLIPWQPFDHNENQLISWDTLRDCSNFIKFKRVGLGRLDWSDDLPVLLNNRVIEKLLQCQGYLILYIHLGDRQDRSDHRPLSVSTVKTLEKLAGLYHDGNLWIHSTSRLLKYNFLTKFLKWSVEEGGDNLLIHLQAASLSMNHHEFDVSDLAGLTFFVPQNRTVEIYYQGIPVKVQKNPMDTEKRCSVSIPISPLDWPF